MSQKQLAKIANIPISNVSKYESGSMQMTPLPARKLAKVLGVVSEKFFAKIEKNRSEIKYLDNLFLRGMGKPHGEPYGRRLH